MSWTSEKCSNILQHHRLEALICILKYFWAWHLPNPHISSSPQATLEEWGWRWLSQVTVHDISLSSAFPPFSPCITLFVPVQNILFAIAEQALRLVFWWYSTFFLNTVSILTYILTILRKNSQYYHILLTSMLTIYPSLFRVFLRVLLCSRILQISFDGGRLVMG